jgi:hypothetical protein
MRRYRDLGQWGRQDLSERFANLLDDAGPDSLITACYQNRTGYFEAQVQTFQSLAFALRIMLHRVLRDKRLRDVRHP